MRPPDDVDPVIASVAAYSHDPTGYERRYAHHLLDRPLRFAALLPQAARILDLGCGPGRDLALFRGHGHRPIGLELNPSFVEMARARGEVVAGDLRDLSSHFPAASFEGIWAQASLVHLDERQTRKTLAAMYGVLVPGGLVYACVSATGGTGWRDESDGRRWYCAWPRRSFPDAMASEGFEVLDVTDGPYVEVWARRPPATGCGPAPIDPA